MNETNFRELCEVFCSTLLVCFLILVASSAASAQEVDPHDSIPTEDKYPSAETCKSCHPVHYKEWSVSSHAYAQLSPIAIGLQAAVTKLTNGTNGDFCIRCHNQVGMNEGEPVFIANAERHQTSREGVSCVVCHRRSKPFGKVSGRFGMEEGDLTAPVYGPTGNEEVARVIESGEFDVETDSKKKGRKIHRKAFHQPQLSTSAFCGSCHDVNFVTGHRLEEAFSEYRASPAARRGVSCQDCHMGKVPGKPEGYDYGPAAIVGGKPTKARKRTNHMFVGPDRSILHPGIFPHNSAARDMANIKEWLQFDYLKGWGTDEFEDNVDENFVFPDKWINISDRYEAREIIEENLALLKKKDAIRKRLLLNAYDLGEIDIDRADRRGIKFSVQVKNKTDGHNAPTGFDAERVVFLRVTVSDRNGKVVFKSGDPDPNGDLRDAHSVYVHNGELPLDKYLFNLQSKFLVRMIRGGEREQVLPVNYSVDPLPFTRPPTSSTLLKGRPEDVRKHRKTIPPLGSKWAKYVVEKSELQGAEGPFRANVKLIAGMAPVNLIHAMRDAGFDDYGLSPRAAAEAAGKTYEVLRESEFELKPGSIELRFDESKE